MRRSRVIVLLLAALLVAGCGGSGHQAPTTTQRHRPHPPPRPKPKPTPTGTAKLEVTILDGDLRVRVPGATVRLAGRRGRTNRNGLTVLEGPRSTVSVAVSAHGYSSVEEQVSFEKSRAQTIRIYQPDLQWPLYGATYARTQAQTHIRLRPPFHVIWSRGMGRLIEFPAVVYDGIAYIGNARGTVRAISMRTGDVVWTHVTPGYPRMASSVGIYGDELVYHTMGGWVHVLDRATGRVRWSWNAGAPIEPSPLIKDGVDYFADAGGMVYALDLSTHRLRWSRSLGAKITSSVAFEGGRLFVGDYAGRLWALRSGNGATIWTGQVNGKIYGTPAVSDGRVFVSSSTGDSVTAFSTSGRYLWRFTTPGYYIYSSPAVWDGRVCFGSYDGSFYGVVAATGRVAWRVYIGGWISGAATIVDGVAYAGSFAHRIVGVDVRTGRKLFTFPHGEYVPVSGNGMRLLLHGFTRLYAVEPRRPHAG